MTTFLAAQSVDMSSLFHFPWIRPGAVLTYEGPKAGLRIDNPVGDDMELAGELAPAGGGTVDFVTRLDPDGQHVGRIVFDQPQDVSDVLSQLQATNGVAAWFAGDDSIDGSKHADRLHGAGGDDTISGGGGDDFIHGGEGADVLRGGQGADSFEYREAFESMTDAPDLILGFHGHAGDRIDLFQIDADVNTAGDQAFTHVGEAFTGAAGELTINRLPGVFRIEGDIDGDAAADFAILVMAGGSLTSADFIL